MVEHASTRLWPAVFAIGCLVALCATPEAKAADQGTREYCFPQQALSIGGVHYRDGRAAVDQALGQPFRIRKWAVPGTAGAYRVERRQRSVAGSEGFDTGSGDGCCDRPACCHAQRGTSRRCAGRRFEANAIQHWAGAVSRSRLDALAVRAGAIRLDLRGATVHFHEGQRRVPVAVDTDSTNLTVPR